MEPDASYAEIALPTALRQVFTYAVPEEFRAEIQIGQRVMVRFGAQTLAGYVVGFTAKRPEVARVRSIERIHPPEVLFPPEILDLTRWVADYYIASWGQVLESALPRTVRGGVVRERKRKQLAAAETPVPPSLFPQQQVAVEAIRAALERRAFTPFLLHGTTGSGKTEVYLEAVEAVLLSGGSALYLVPEIALGAQILRRLEARFPGQVGLYHSQAGEGNRRRVWRDAREGRLRFVLGARSAVFCPLVDLRLVIVDEEHEPAFKQDETPRYHGRDTAVVRARRSNTVVVLGSATPSLESLRNAQLGKYTLLSMPERVDSRPPARVTLVDLGEVHRQAQERKVARADQDPDDGPEARARRQEDAWVDRVFSDLLREKILDRLARGEQTILFLNRRGHSTVVQCADCGHTLQCTQCDVVLTFHKGENALKCHYCGAVRKHVDACEICSGHRFFFGGFGTQRVEEALGRNFPGVRVARMDQDATRKKGAHDALIQAMERREIDLLLGTQMVAKGLHFPNVTLVGVLQADREMLMPDFRAQERAFQLLTQVAGRSGRGAMAGEVIFQTLMPDHYAVACAATADFEGFAARELAVRELFRYPPFTRMVHLLLDGPVEENVRRRSDDLRDFLLTRLGEQRGGVRILGPAPMPLSRLKGQYRWVMTLKGRNSDLLRQLATEALEAKPPRGLSGVRIQADVDPVSMI
ncbi:MAG: primosomal protein N' [Candidatus Eisenbacteria bacterium]|nr:primosomal protein N' [Candidatus Eisenbacteria bacterium]